MYVSHREGCRGWYKSSLPVCRGRTVDECVKRTVRYLGYLEDFFVVEATTQEEVYRYDHTKDKF